MPPNILLISTDQQHFDTLGVKNPRIKTPHLDRLAREGVMLDRAYCTNPLCSPSRSSIITGQYPSTHGCWTIGTKLDEDRPTVGAILGDAGYQTTLIGKAHFQPLASRNDQTSLETPSTMRNLDFWKTFHGPYYGFNRVELARNHGDADWTGQHYALWMEAKGLTNWRDYFQDGSPDSARTHTWDLPEEFHYTNFVTERSITAMERAAYDDEPFFVWASYQDPHPPYLVPEPWASMYNPADMEPGILVADELSAMAPWFQMTQEEDPDFSEYAETAFANHGFKSHLIADEALRINIAIYYGMISFIDAGVGRLLDLLDRLGQAENTLVVFTTDHGNFLGQHGLTAKGAFHYEDLIRIPMLARYPGTVPAGIEVHELQSLVDLAPTFLSAAGLPVPLEMQGVDQLAAWRGGGAARDHIFVENRHQPTAVHLRTYVDQRYKITFYRDRPWGDLFDLEADPEERRNVFNDPAYADVKARLFDRFINAELRREVSKYERIAVA